jgi:hypothetical protein
MRRAAASFAFSLLVWGVMAGSAAAAPAGPKLQPYGIEGMGVVSTAADEGRASVSPDGMRIVWSSDREGGTGGRDLWQARRVDGRWQDARPLPFNSAGGDFDPVFSTNGRWLYFASGRDGGAGGSDLYRVELRADGSGVPVNLGAAVNTAGDERAPTPSLDGRSLLFASDGHGGAGGHELLVATWGGQAFVAPQPVPGVNTAADEYDATWLGNGRALVFARSDDGGAEPVRLWVAQCDGTRYADAQPLALAFNTADGRTSGPALDRHRPGELLLSGRAKAPKAGGIDIYRIKAPRAEGQAGCL